MIRLRSPFLWILACTILIQTLAGQQPPEQKHKMTLQLLETPLSICRLGPNMAIPDWAAGNGEFLSITRTADELSIICSDTAAPREAKCERGWRALKIAGPLDFSLTGVLTSVAAPLAEAGVSIFAVSTYDTDYVLVKEQNLDKAIRTLSKAGHTVKSD